MSETLTIGEVARRSGVPATTLRYYEDVGLLTDVARAPSGYRQYDEAVLARLAFVTRAKELDCTLDEITDLVRAWDGEDCADVQHRLRLLVRDKIAAADQRLRDLIALTADLRRSLAGLEALQASGPCDADCTCLLPRQAEERRLVGPVLDSPVACTLPPDEAPERLADWQAVLAGAVDREPTAEGVRLTLGPDVDVAEVSRLLVAEHGCCSFLRFALTVDDRGVAVEVAAPDDARDLVDGLFG